MEYLETQGTLGRKNERHNTETYKDDGNTDPNKHPGVTPEEGLVSYKTLSYYSVNCACRITQSTVHVVLLSQRYMSYYS
jgi:hypothetical protein